MDSRSKGERRWRRTISGGSDWREGGSGSESETALHCAGCQRANDFKGAGAMPIYEFQCKKCDHQFEVLRPVSKAGAGAKCPKWKGAGRRLFTAAVLVPGESSDMGGDFGGLGGGMGEFGGGMGGGMGGGTGGGMGDFGDDF